MVKNYTVAYPLRILDSKFENNKVFYLVQWRNLRLPTWEPKKNIANRQDLIDEYRDLSILENLELDDCAYIYCRVSSKRQSDIGHTSLEVQEDLCKQYCLNNDIKVIKVVKEAYSARNMDRLDGLKYLCDIATSGQKIVVYDVSRFSRNTRQALNIIENLKQNKVSVYAVVEKLSYDTPSEQQQFRMQLSCAQQYTDMLSLKISNSVSYRLCNGHSLGTAAFGFKHIRDNNNIRKKVVNVEEMKIIERIRQLQTEKIRTIVNILIEENIQFRDSSPTLLNVRKIIKRFDNDLSEVNRNSGKVRKLRTRKNKRPY